jgi:hypothetical protein
MRTPPSISCPFFLDISKKIAPAIAHVIVMMALTLTAVGQHVTITTANLPNGVVNNFYAAFVSTSHGCTPFKWDISSGKLPPGLNGQVSPSTRSFRISGTPIATGSASFSVLVTGCGGHTSENTYTVQIQQPVHTVELSWDAPTSGATMGYKVYRGTNSGGPYFKINIGGLIASTAYTDATVASGTTYYYVTTSVSSSNQESAYSKQATAEIP